MKSVGRRSPNSNRRRRGATPRRKGYARREKKKKRRTGAGAGQRRVEGDRRGEEKKGRGLGAEADGGSQRAEVDTVGAGRRTEETRGHPRHGTCGNPPPGGSRR